MALRTWKGAFGAGLAVVVAGAVAAAANAHAGIYHVYSCRTPAGALAPADGWSAYAHGNTAIAENTCAKPSGGLLAAFVESEYGANEGDAAGWRFALPPGERLAAARLWRAGDVDGGFTTHTTYETWLGGASRSSAFDECVASAGCTTGRGNQAEPFASANLVSAPRASLGEGISANVGCSGRVLGCAGRVLPPLTDGYAARLVLYAVDLTLEQEAGPSVADVSGALATAPAVSGASELTFTASDAGAGVYAALVSVDGTLLERTPLDSNGGRCRDVGGTTDGSAAFLYLQPCASTVSSSAALDTTTLSNGAHRVQASIVDAAGNSVPVLDRMVVVANGAPCATVSDARGGSVLGAAWRGTSHATITSGFASAHVIAGTLRRTDGTPIAGARIEVFGVASGGAATLVVTDAAGGFSVRVPGGGPSRALCLAYHGSAPGNLVTRELGLSVRAPVALTVLPHTVSVGRTIRFSGRLLGGHVPAGGKPVILEARSALGGWLEFRVVRSDAHGRFRASYRFRFPGPATYEFRVLCEAEADYPFARGASNVVRVRER
jgi:hypothetical protein